MFGCGLILLTAVSVVSVPGEAPSLLPEGKKFALVWHDEFNGDKLDVMKWCYRTNFWGRRFAAFAAPEDNAVEVKDGLVHLKVLKLPNGQFVSPQLQTGGLIWDIPHLQDRKSLWPLPKRDKPLFEHRYGYYECRFRLQRMPGWWSAFWMQSSNNGTTLDPARSGIEHDIMESFEPGEIRGQCFHYNGYGIDYKGFNIPRGTQWTDTNAVVHVGSDDFHTIGLLWEPDGYTVYLDGVPRGEKVGSVGDEAVSHVPEFLLLTTECKWYRDDCMTGKGVSELETAVAADDDFVVDYVRVYDVIEKGGVTVDFDVLTGPMKPLHGVNGSPVRHESKDKIYNQSQDELHDAGVPYCRLHDVAGRYGLGHYVDIPNVFPNFDADENDPASYDFDFTDAYLKTLVKSGVKPYYRLGATIEGVCEIKPYNILPPKDPGKWARICEHVIAHYNEGWADGYRWNLEYWEIWNEPEPGWSMWYKGTKEQFFTLYETAAKHLKKRFPNIKIGGYGSIGFYAVDQPEHPGFGSGTNVCCNTTQYAEDFLKRMCECGAPLDFFSWHLYLKPPYPLERITTHASYCRALLDRYGFTAAESHFNEWNVVGDITMDKGPKDWDAIKDAPVAAQVAAAFAVLQNAPVDKAMYYCALPIARYCGLFYWPSEKVTPVYDAFVAFNALYGRKMAARAVSDIPNVYALAAADATSGEAILLVNIGHEPQEVDLKVSGAKGGRFRVRRIDGENKRLADVGLFATGQKIQLPPSSISLLESENQSPHKGGN